MEYRENPMLLLLLLLLLLMLLITMFKMCYEYILVPYVLTLYFKMKELYICQ